MSGGCSGGVWLERQAHPVTHVRSRLTAACGQVQYAYGLPSVRVHRQNAADAWFGRARSSTSQGQHVTRRVWPGRRRRCNGNARWKRHSFKAPAKRREMAESRVPVGSGRVAGRILRRGTALALRLRRRLRDGGIRAERRGPASRVSTTKGRSGWSFREAACRAMHPRHRSASGKETGCGGR